MILAQTAAQAATVIAPAVDPLGLPAPQGWFMFLLLLTMFLHVVFMNFVLGGSLLATGLNVAALLGRRQANTTVNLIYQTMPPAISLAITMGVAPLLFVQVLYGPYFYSANVLMGLAWFSFFIVLLGGFYLTYWVSLRGSSLLQRRVGAWDNQPGRRLVVGLATTACFLWIAWVLTNNHELSLHPARWASGGQWKSPRWFVSAPSTIPRYLHNLVGATAVAGVWLAGIGWWRSWRWPDQRQPSVALVRFGLFTAVVLTIVQIVVGLVFFFTLDEPTRLQMLGFKTVMGGVWTVALILAIALPGIMAWAAAKPERLQRTVLSVAAMAIVLASMLLGHEQDRLSSLAQPAAGTFALDRWAIYPQPVSLLLFLVLLVIALAVAALMIRWILDRRHQDAGPRVDTMARE